MSADLHKNLGAGRWYELSLAQQLGNIGSEISRAKLAQNKDDARFWGAVARGQELFFDFGRQTMVEMEKKRIKPRL